MFTLYGKYDREKNPNWNTTPKKLTQVADISAVKYQTQLFLAKNKSHYNLKCRSKWVMLHVFVWLDQLK